jgi:hypothetical protein
VFQKKARALYNSNIWAAGRYYFKAGVPPLDNVLARTLCNIDNSNSEITLPKLHNITFSYMDTVDITSIECVEHFSAYCDSLKISKNECIQVEIATRDQQANPIWKEARIGRLTASKFGNIVRRKINTEPDNILKYLLDYTPSFTNAAVLWGRDHVVYEQSFESAIQFWFHLHRILHN